MELQYKPQITRKAFKSFTFQKGIRQAGKHACPSIRKINATLVRRRQFQCRAAETESQGESRCPMFKTQKPCEGLEKTGDSLHIIQDKISQRLFHIAALVQSATVAVPSHSLDNLLAEKIRIT